MESTALRVLLIEDNPGDARLIREMIAEVPAARLRLEWVDTLAQGRERLTSDEIDAVLLDLSLPDSQGLGTFQSVHASSPEVPIVVLSGLADEEVALTAVREGAQDYLIKGRVDGDLLVRSLRYAVERQALAVENARLYRQAQDALRLRDAVLSSVSHDLRNPLTAIRVITDTLRFQLTEGELASDSASLREGLAHIDANAQRMAGQIDELLDVARLQTGRPLKLRRRPTDLIALARDVIADQQRRTSRHQIRLETNLPELTGIWDAGRLERVLGNLLANAVKYSFQGGDIVVRVTRESDGERAYAVLQVEDHGVGIPAADLPHVFRWYYRGANVAEQVAGSGIGLAGARQIVEQHGGTISVESQESIGSTFTVRLPLRALSVQMPLGDDSFAQPVSVFDPDA